MEQKEVIDELESELENINNELEVATVEEEKEKLQANKIELEERIEILKNTKTEKNESKGKVTENSKENNNKEVTDNDSLTEDKNKEATNNKEIDYKKYVVKKPYLDNELGRVVSEGEELLLIENRAKEIIEILPGYIELIKE